MRLVDVLGREIMRPLEQQKMENGNHSLSLDLSGLPTGIYQCRIFTGNNVYTLPIIHHNELE
ncbi:MAG: T9SS type A sorting domain-containing protein [Ignavibacteria bacterium]|nr:T9SS type A sorting domain-containing protein [Ignavibacteria bacterium]